MIDPLKSKRSSLTPDLAAPQHKPRPLPLFLELLRSEAAGKPELMTKALAGIRAYQEAPRAAPRPLMPAVAEARGASVRDYGGDGPAVLFVPSLINPPTILDLDQERSLLRWLAARGHRVLLLDWGWDGETRRGLSVTGHVEEILLPLMAAVGEPVNLVGYCLGGTMTAAAAGPGSARSLATIAAPWHFSGFPNESREMLAKLWYSAEPVVDALGCLPMEVLQSAFWSLDPARSVAKFAAFADLDPASPKAQAFVALEDWANDGPPVSDAAGREMFDGFFARDVPGSGSWTISGAIADPAALPCPVISFVSTSDRIVPHATAMRTGGRIGLAQGHVGMIVGSRAREVLWEPLDAWLSSAARRR